MTQTCLCPRQNLSGSLRISAVMNRFLPFCSVSRPSTTIPRTHVDRLQVLDRQFRVTARTSQTTDLPIGLIQQRDNSAMSNPLRHPGTSHQNKPPTSGDSRCPAQTSISSRRHWSRRSEHFVRRIRRQRNRLAQSSCPCRLTLTAIFPQHVISFISYNKANNCQLFQTSATRLRSALRTPPAVWRISIFSNSAAWPHPRASAFIQTGEPQPQRIRSGRLHVRSTAPAEQHGRVLSRGSAIRSHRIPAAAPAQTHAAFRPCPPCAFRHVRSAALHPTAGQS